MESSPIDFGFLQRWCIISVLVLVECVVWVGTIDSGIAKLPILLLGALLIAALFASEAILKRQVDLSISAVDAIVLLHIPLFVVSAILHFDPVYTWGALSLGIACLVFYFAAASFFPTRKNVHLLFTVLEWLTFFLCLVAVIQYFFTEQLPLQFEVGPHRRVSSLLGNSGYFASYLVIMFPLVLGRAFNAGFSSTRSRFRWVLLPAIGLSLLATQTRSSILGCGASAAVFVLLAPITRRARFAGMGLVILLFGAALLPYLIRPESGLQSGLSDGGGRGSTLSRRIYFWSAGKNAILDAPLFGHGIGSFEHSDMEYRSPDYWTVGSEDIVPHAHNEIIEIAVEYGFTGIILFLLTFSLVLGRGMRLALKGTGWQSWTATGITSALVGIGVDNLAGVSLRQAPVAVLAWTIMGIFGSEALSAKKGWKIAIPWRMPGYAAVLPLVLSIAGLAWYGKSQLRMIDASVHMQRALEKTKSNSSGTVEEYRAAINEDPMNLLGRSQLALALLNTGRFPEALREIDDLQALSPLYPKSHLMKAFAQLRLGQLPDALTSIGEELRKRSHPEAYQIQAEIFRRLREPGNEREALLNVLRKDLESRQAYGYATTLTRLVELNRTENDRKECLAFIDSMVTIVSQDHSFFDRVKRQLSADQAPFNGP